jgi:putative phage-type endonuclease
MLLHYTHLRKGCKLYKYIAEELGNAEFLGDFEPGSPEWHQLRMQGIGGSDVGTVLGLNPYESAYTLWHKKKGLIAEQNMDDNIAVFIGNSMEEPILRRFAEKHPELEIWTTGTWRSKKYGWMHANPDGIFRHRETGEWGIIEVKTGRNPWIDIPPAYRAQVMWYLTIFGFNKAYIVGTPGYVWEERRIDFDQFESDAYVAGAYRFIQAFMEDRKPEWDGSLSTYETVREIHPDIARASEIEVGEIGIGLWNAQKRFDEAQAELNQYKSSVLDAMGVAQHATVTVDGEGTFRVASRQSRRDGLPYLVVKK